MSQMSIEINELGRKIPIIAAAYPAPTQLQLWALLTALQHGEHFTFLDAVERLGICALSQRCGDLRKLGWPIVSRWDTTVNGARIKVYSL